MCLLRGVNYELKEAVVSTVKWLLAGVLIVAVVRLCLWFKAVVSLESGQRHDADLR